MCNARISFSHSMLARETDRKCAHLNMNKSWWSVSWVRFLSCRLYRTYISFSSFISSIRAYVRSYSLRSFCCTRSMNHRILALWQMGSGISKHESGETDKKRQNGVRDGDSSARLLLLLTALGTQSARVSGVFYARAFMDCLIATAYKLDER